jgi:hypothetical protein
MKRWFWQVVVVALVAGGVGLLSYLLATNSAPTTSSGDQPTAGIPWFEDVTAAAGIDFQQFDCATPTHYIHETLGSGVAWIDYDNDGLLDLFCVQDGPIKPGEYKGPLPTNKLYRNLGNGKFQDVTAQVGLDRAGFHLGCAVGDFDNDGYDDLVVTYWGGIVLYHNEPDGHGGRKFVDVTARAKLNNHPHLATSCGWADIDGDGRLDLYVCNYVVLNLRKYPRCYLTKENEEVATACQPSVFRATKHNLYRNNGDGTFTDISTSSGIAAVPAAPGLAVVLCDLDNDGKIDIYAANDLKPAYLFHNQGNGKFVEKAMSRGCGVDRNGKELAGMGIAVGDVDGSGQPSLYVTNFQNRPNILFLNRGQLQFRDVTAASGLEAPTLSRLAFGTVMLDADLDGRLDIAVANGHISRAAPHLLHEPYAQRAQFFQGLGRGKFRDVSDLAGPYFRKEFVGRGLACGDFDNDGLPDLAYSHVGGPLVLLRNATSTNNHWLTLELEGDGIKSNRNAIGARVEVVAGGQRQVRWVIGGGSYLSASSRRLYIGLDQADSAEKVLVTWPSGRQQTFSDLAGQTWWRLREGKDRPVRVK